jgi:hypothetical protein
MKRFITLLVNITVISFILNTVWENAQAPLYAGYANFWEHFQICFWGVLGDMVIIIILYAIFALGYGNIWWIESWGMQSIIRLIFIGMIMAIMIEYYALSVGRWAYAPTMPLFLWTKAGLLPVLQMMILPYVTFYYVRQNMKII